MSNVIAVLFITLILNFSFAVDDKIDSSCDKNACKESDGYHKINHWKSFGNEFIRHKEEHLLNNSECIGIKCFRKQLEDDLRPFPLISKTEIEDIIERIHNSVIYQIIDGKVFRSKDCLFPLRCQGIDYFLKKISSKINNTEFVVNTYDWPHMNKHLEDKPLPLFSFSKTSDYYDIMYPAWSFWAGGPATKLYPKGLGRWDQWIEHLEESYKENPWVEKSDKAFFRGSRTSSERDQLILLSRAEPDLVDAKYTKNQAWKSKEDTLGEEPADEISLYDHCRYKYLFNFRGVAASFRFKHLFLCGSLIIHVGSEWQEFFYSAMKPWVHYVPFDAKAKQEEIADLLSFLKNNQKISQEIAENGRNFIKKNLTMADVKRYWLRLLKSYTKRLDYAPQRREHLIQV